MEVLDYFYQAINEGTTKKDIEQKLLKEFPNHNLTAQINILSYFNQTAKSLGKIGEKNKQIISALVKSTKDHNHKVRLWAAFSLFLLEQQDIAKRIFLDHLRGVLFFVLKIICM